MQLIPTQIETHSGPHFNTANDVWMQSSTASFSPYSALNVMDYARTQIIHPQFQSPYYSGPNSHFSWLGENALKPAIDLAMTGLSKIDQVISHFINFIPGAYAHAGAGAEADPCPSPLGSYINSCSNITITPQPDGSCKLTANCNTIIPAIPPQPSEIHFNPRDPYFLGNNNGTLEQFSAVKANKEIQQIFEEDSHHQDCKTDDKEMCELTSKTLIARQAEVLSKLPSGQMISLSDKRLIVLTEENRNKLISNPKIVEPFQDLAKSTGGIVGLTKNSNDLPHLIDVIFTHISQNVAADTPLDITFVLDSTSSMSNDIKAVKENLTNLLINLRERKEINPIRVALLEYRDKTDDFLNRVVAPLRPDLDHIQGLLNRIKVDGGGDTAEAALDALLVAKELNWKENAKKSIILITDAPYHSTTADGRYSQREIIESLSSEDIHIAVYPILTKS